MQMLSECTLRKTNDFYLSSYDGMTLLTAIAALAFVGVVSYSMKKLAHAEAEELKKKRLAKKTQSRPPSWYCFLFLINTFAPS